MEGSVDSFISDLAAQLGGPGPNLCTSTKYKAAGRKAKGKLDCVAKADTKVPACITTGDGTTVEGMVDSLFDDVKYEQLP